MKIFGPVFQGPKLASLSKKCITDTGPLQLAIHVVQFLHAVEQRSNRDKTNKGNYHVELVCLLFALP